MTYQLLPAKSKDRLILCGGAYGSTGVTDQCYKYLIETNEWIQFATMSDARMTAAFVQLNDDTFMITGWCHCFLKLV